MLIDWFTVVAQLINFVILLVALRFLLYDRILDVMEERRRRFVDREEQTEKLRREAEEEAEKAEADRREIESNWEEMMDEARREAEERRRELMEEARSEVESRERQWLDSLRARQDQLLVELQRETGERAVAISRRAMADLAGADVERLMVAAFADRMAEMTESDDEILEDLRSEEPLVVRTAFSLSDEHRDTVRETLRDLLDEKREIEWEHDPDLIAGISLKVDSRSVGWSIETYLDDVEDRFARVLREQMEETSEAVQAAVGEGVDEGGRVDAADGPDSPERDEQEKEHTEEEKGNTEEEPEKEESAQESDDGQEGDTDGADDRKASQGAEGS